MLNKKKFIFLLFFISAVVIMISVSYYFQVTSFPHVYKDPKKSRLDKVATLMNTKKYAKEAERAGYEVDDYYLKMNKRIIHLTIQDNPKILISAPTDNKMNYDVIIHKGSKEIIISLIVDKKNHLLFYEGSIHEKGKETLSYKLNKKEITYYYRTCVNMTDKMLETIYETSWGK
ncbi:Uncharacterised protein [Listeria grayi]|uniref:Uncharacterized protein n=1 Tax=Listeria grayi FSL F6-1183 TaxID=1265827 RepID=A0A829R9V0_LISGR|nr:hypothetical protein [Listeria grayi]EUJ30607.1 hypothetical protein LMUR_00550 [Listeria grayi FSL F6-1183]VEI31868.1 Uncharacterised protein [Listeria grayi]